MSRVTVDRAVEVICDRGAAASPRWSVGSGFLIGGRQVLTAAHNIGPGRLLVRCDDDVERTATTVLLPSSATTDIAMLEIVERAFVGPPAVGFAVLDRTSPDPIERCWAVGFPRWKEHVRAHGRRLRDAAHVFGVIAPGANRRSGLLELHVTSTPRPLPREGGLVGSEWQGMSGAVVFTTVGAQTDVAVGVVTEHAIPEGQSTLAVVPISAVAEGGPQAAEWWRSLGISRAEALLPLPRRPVGIARVAPSGQETNLRRPPRRLIGRETELVALRDALMDGGPQVVTITGAGGTGKTRLAVEAGFELLDGFPDGVFFVDLAPLDSAEQVVPAIAHVLQVRESPTEPLLTAVAAHVHRRNMLIVLDNFEQVRDAADAVSEMVQAAPSTRVLVTSRQPLHLAGEHELSLAPLSAAPAAELFADRAGSALGPLASDPAVAEIVRRLDGLPLAIELAAARVRLLPPRAMLRRMERVLPLLAQSGRDLPARQRTLRGTIDWSYDLLSDRERRLFRRLSVMPGGGTIEAVAAIAGDAELLESLIEKNLVRQRPDKDGEPRFSMLQTVREYAEERLAAEGEDAEAHGLHAEWTARLAEAAGPRLLGSDQDAWLERLEGEEDNIRAAVSWSLEHGDPTVALRIASALIEFWEARGRYRDAAAWLDRGLAAAPDAPAEIRARSLLVVGLAAYRGGDLPAARTATDECVLLAETLGDTELHSRALTQLGWVSMLDAGLDDAVALAERAAELASSVGNHALVAFALNCLAVAVCEEGDMGRSQKLFEEAVEQLRAAGERRNLALVIGNLGKVALLNGDFMLAEETFRAALELSAELGERGRLPAEHLDIAVAALLCGADRDADEHISIALADGWQSGDTATVIGAVNASAGLHAVRGDDRAAAVLTGAAHAAAEDYRMPLTDSDELVDERLLQPVSERLGARAWQLAVTEGRSLGLEQAVSRASALAV